MSDVRPALSEEPIGVTVGRRSAAHLTSSAHGAGASPSPCRACGGQGDLGLASVSSRGSSNLRWSSQLPSFTHWRLCFAVSALAGCPRCCKRRATGIHTRNRLVTKCSLQELEEIVLLRKLEQTEQQKLQSLGVL